MKSLSCFRTSCGNSAPGVPAALGIPSAASKVFGIFELFERILFFYGCNDAKINHEGYIIQPSLGLYRLQNVNHIFRDYTADSKKLRQLMFLEPMDYPRPANRSQDHAPLVWFLGNMLSGRLDNIWAWRQKWNVAFHYNHPDTTLRNLLQGEGMIHLKRTDRNASWRDMKICNPMDASMLFPIQFVAASIASDFYRHFAISYERIFQRECSAQSTLGEFWDTYLALEAELMGLVKSFEQLRHLRLAEREAFTAQANVSPYMMYAMKQKWAYEDKDFQNRLDGDIGGFCIWQQSGARIDSEASNAED